MEGVDLLLALAAHLHQARLLQQVQVVGDAGLADGEALGQLARIEVPALKALQDLLAGGIAQSLEYEGAGFHSVHLVQG